jgi:hypothetical protein
MLQLSSSKNQGKRYTAGAWKGNKIKKGKNHVVISSSSIKSEIKKRKNTRSLRVNRPKIKERDTWLARGRANNSFLSSSNHAMILSLFYVSSTTPINFPLLCTSIYLSF